MNGHRRRRSMTLFLVALIAGLGIGAVYALLALSFSVVYTSTGIFNVAQGDLLTVGVLISYYALMVWHIPEIADLALILATLVVLSLVEERIAVRPFLVRSSASQGIGWFISTLAFGLIVSTVCIEVYGDHPALPINSMVGQTPIYIGSVAIPPTFIFAIGVVLVIAVALEVFYRRTWQGMAMRAIAEDRDVSALRGIHVVRISRMAFVVAALVTGLAAYAIAPIVYANVTAGLEYGLKGFIALAIGGFGSIRGCVIGGFALGIAEQMFDLYVSSYYEILAGLILLMLVLTFRPTGLFGSAVRDV
jgi:branched-chain amino acid transport system permease protein